MNNESNQKHFGGAAVKSESYRIAGLLCLLGVLIPSLIGRDIAAGRYRLLYAQTLMLLLTGAYEVYAWTTIRRALRADRDVARAFWLINVLIEAALPTLALFILIEIKVPSPDPALVAPPVFLYFLFIILSTLRLSPRLSILEAVILEASDCPADEVIARLRAAVQTCLQGDATEG